MIFFVLTLSLALASFCTQDIPNLRRNYPDLNISELRKLDKLFRFGDREMYDRRQAPGAEAGTATKVHIEMYIRSFGSINPIQMDYTVDLYLRQRWLEFRFLNNSLTRPLDLSDPILVKMLWKPEVYFPNAKESDFQYVTVPNVMLRIHPDGTILYILRLKLTFSCMMDLSSFPLDQQTCYMQVASFVKTTRELELVWYKNDPIKIYQWLKLPQFEMIDIKADACTLSFHIGNYSCLQAVFELHRNVGYHLVQSYLPTSLIVVVSWVSFWLDVDAIPSRVTLGVTTLLTVCSESTSFRDKMPTVSYVKALDIWMGSCTAFVFLALVEFTVVNHLARHHRRFLFWGSSYARQTLAGGGNGDTSQSYFGPSSPIRVAADQQAPSSSSTQTFSFSRLSKHHETDGKVKQRTSQNFADQHETKVADEGGVYKILTSCHAPTHPEEVKESPKKTPLGLCSDSPDDSARRYVATASTSFHDIHDGSPHAQKFNLRHDQSEMSELDLSSLPSLWRREAVMAKNIDKTCRALFPAMFILFNIIYWVYYKVLA